MALVYKLWAEDRGAFSESPKAKVDYFGGSSNSFYIFTWELDGS